MGAIENVREDPLSDPVGRMRLATAQDLPVPARHKLDSPVAMKTHQWLLGHVLYEKRRQGPNRRQMAIDHDYYDSEQFTDEDLLELAERGQAALVYNMVKRTVDWVIGTEKRTRFDFKVLGRTRNDVVAARAKTDAMKYLQDVNRSAFYRSQAFRECVISGQGWLETGIRGDSDEEPIYTTNESWWYSLGDSHAMKLDNTDARYHFRWRWVDLDIAMEMFPDREAVINGDVVAGGAVDEKLLGDYYLGNRLTGEDYISGHLERRLAWSNANMGFVDSTRERVRIYEGWFKRPIREQTMRAKELPMFNGQAYDAANDDMRHALVIGDATLVDRMNMRCFYGVFTETGLLAAGRSPYHHNEFPFTPVYCYRRGRDNAPYGIIRGIRDPQDGFNRRMAKSIFAYTAYRVIASADAIDEKRQSWEDIRNEAGRPDALLVKKTAGSELKVERDKEIGDAQFKIAQTEAGLILDASGVTADNLGLESNAESGKAIIAKQSEGAAVTAEIFDNFRFACQLHGEKELSLIEQFWSDEKQLRITDAKGRPTYRSVNKLKQDPETGEVQVLNDITATKADFVIDQQDFHATIRRAASETLMGVLPKVGNLDPKLTLRILRMAVDASDWPNKEEIVKELDQITGYKDPAAALTPEEQQEQEEAERQQAEQAKQQAEQQQAAFKAELEGMLAKAENDRASAEKMKAEAAKVRLEAQKLAAGAEDGQDQALATATAAIEEQAQAQLEEANRQITELNAKLRNRDGEIAAEKFKAEQDREARVAVADRQFRPQPANPAAEEALADLTQDMGQLAGALKDLVGKLDSDKKEMGQQITDLAKRIEQAAADAATAKDDEKKSEKSGKAAAPQVVIHNHIPKAGRAKGKTVTMTPDGKSARIEPDPEDDGD